MAVELRDLVKLLAAIILVDNPDLPPKEAVAKARRLLEKIDL